MVFRDPIQEVRGLEDFLALYRRLLERMRSLEWTIELIASGLPGGPRLLRLIRTPLA